MGGGATSPVTVSYPAAQAARRLFSQGGRKTCGWGWIIGGWSRSSHWNHQSKSSTNLIAARFDQPVVFVLDRPLPCPMAAPRCCFSGLGPHPHSCSHDASFTEWAPAFNLHLACRCQYSFAMEFNTKLLKLKFSFYHPTCLEMFFSRPILANIKMKWQLTSMCLVFNFIIMAVTHRFLSAAQRHDREVCM